MKQITIQAIRPSFRELMKREEDLWSETVESSPNKDLFCNMEANYWSRANLLCKAAKLVKTTEELELMEERVDRIKRTLPFVRDFMLDEFGTNQLRKRLDNALSLVKQNNPSLVEQNRAGVKSSASDLTSYTSSPASSTSSSPPSSRRESRASDSSDSSSTSEDPKSVLSEKPLSAPPSIFRRHSVGCSADAVAGVGLAASGFYTFAQYLADKSPFEWLTADQGMGTPADLAIILALALIALCIGADYVENKMTTDQSNDQTAVVATSSPGK